MHVGSEFPVLEKEEITHIQLVRYAGASGDFNPIHTVVPAAEKAGLGGVIAHGMLLMGFVGQAIGTWFPDRELAEFSVRFKAMTRPGELIILTGEVVDEDENEWSCAAYAKNQDEVKVSAEFKVKKTGT